MEQKKLLWVIFSAVGFVFIVAAAGLVLFWPQDKTMTDEGEQAAGAVARDFDPVEWVREGEEYPGIEEDAEAEEGENLILVYGESGEEAEAEETEAETPEDADAGDEDTVPETITGKDGVEIEVYQPGKTERKTEPAAAEAPAAEESEPVSRRLTEYWIQAGSYTSRTRADEVKQQLSEKGIASIITSKTVNDTDYYRVRIGPYGSKEEAQKFLGWIQGVQGFESSYVSMVYVTRRIN